MFAVIVHTLTKTFAKVVSNSTDHFMWNGNNFLTKGNCSIDRGRWVYTFDLGYPQRNKITRSDDRASQPISPHNEVKWPWKISLKIPILEV